MYSESKTDSVIDALIREEMLDENEKGLGITAKGWVHLAGVLENLFHTQVLSKHELNAPYTEVFFEFCQMITSDCGGPIPTLVRYYSETL